MFSFSANVKYVEARINDEFNNCCSKLKNAHEIFIFLKDDKAKNAPMILERLEALGNILNDDVKLFDALRQTTERLCQLTQDFWSDESMDKFNEGYGQCLSVMKKTRSRLEQYRMDPFLRVLCTLPADTLLIHEKLEIVIVYMITKKLDKTPDMPFLIDCVDLEPDTEEETPEVYTSSIDAIEQMVQKHDSLASSTEDSEMTRAQTTTIEGVPLTEDGENDTNDE